MSPSGVAVVVPTRNSARTLGRCLKSVVTQASLAEVVVVDNHSSDETPAIAREHGARLVTAGPERSTQRNVGWRATSAPYVAFVDSDMALEPGVLQQAAATLEEGFEVGAVVLPELAEGEGFFARCRALEKRLYLGDASVEAARVFRREALEQTGGYDEALVAGEDWDLADRVASAGWGTGRTTAFVRHDEGRVSLATTFRKKRYYGRSLSDYLSSPSARRVGRRGLLNVPAAREEPSAYAGLLLLKAVDVLGLVVGVTERKLRGRP